jgi:peptidyl-prolyl cis-trans isomerase SurA
LNQQGDVAKAARDSLIDDRLRHGAAVALDVTAANSEVQQAMTDFASRGKLTAEQLIEYLAKRGVDAESLRDFFKSGIEWRGAVRKKFSGTVVVTEAEIDRAIAAGVAGGSELQVSLAQIFLPKTPDKADPSVLAQRIIDGSATANSFMIYAQKYSKGPTAGGGGLLDWQMMSTLKPEVAALIKGLKPGEVSKALPVEGGIEIYFLRDESPGPATGTPSFDVDYAVMGFAPGQQAAAAQTAAKVISCGALYPVARGLPEEALLRQSVPQRSLSGPLAGALASMDPGETKLVPRADGGTDLVMLCAMIPQTQVPASRDAVRQQLTNRKLALLAEGWLNQLRSDAIIKDR